MGAEVTVGVRPEHLVPVAAAKAALAGDVQITEQLGGETYVYITAEDGGAVTVKYKGQAAVKPGDRLSLGLEAGKFHIFGKDEKIICRG